MEKESFKNGRYFELLFFNGIITIVGNDLDVTQNHTKVSCDCHSKLFCQNMNNAEACCSNANEDFRLLKSYGIWYDIVQKLKRIAVHSTIFSMFFYRPPTKLRESNFFVQVCLSTGGSPCDHSPWCIGPHYIGPQAPLPHGHQTRDPLQFWPCPCPPVKTCSLEDFNPPPVLTSGSHRSTYGCQVGGAHPTEMLFGFNCRHGGPGGGTGPRDRRFFDPSVYRIVLMDQRGAGKSLPPAELKVQYLCCFLWALLKQN